jgi:MFS transporter, MHS family, proline/betaine transporter
LLLEVKTVVALTYILLSPWLMTEIVPNHNPTNMKKVVTASMIGNALEWYDYALYGQMAVLIGALFFPSTDPFLSSLASFGVFAVGFLARPFGGIVFGFIGDRFGRRKALTLSVLLMAGCTAAIGIMPTYAQIGIAAPILLLIIRILQGLSVGGEFSGTIIYLVEHAPTRRRGFVGGAAMVSLVIGFLSGSLTVSALSAWMGEEAFNAWGWRLPFLSGILIGAVGYFIRSHCGESPVYEEAQAANALSATPVREVFLRHKLEMLRAVGAYALTTAPFYIVGIYFIAFNRDVLGLSFAESMQANTYSLLAMLVAVPISAYISDIIGRKAALLAVAGLLFIALLPLFSVLERGAEFSTIVLSELCLAGIIGLAIGLKPALLAELFPTRIRFTGMAISYNFSTALFGGTAPMVAMWLLSVFHTPAAIAVYLMVMCAVAMCSMIGYRDRSRQAL